MPQQYTFETLSARDFEFLCRDLLQRKISVETGKQFYFNSFSEGRDRGIDGIFQDEKEKIILQCKRYKSFNSLYSELKNAELQKITLLNPNRYIFITSIDLSESQVQKLYALLNQYVQDINDIIGQAMINNMLSCYPDIELNYPKLYFNSINVLNRIINAGTFNQSGNKIKEYHKVSKFYVADDSFQQALNVLKENRYVVISGDPGVGKSTLAGMLSLYFVGKEYEFIFLRRGVSEGNNVWQDNKKQIFFFDDFLGGTSFDGFGRNEDRELYDFIKNINKSKDKLLLVTTREYIFRQAIIKYPELNELHLIKCIITQKEFTDAFKINILYNYLYYSPVGLKQIESLLYDERYEHIIHHRNFTPRLISEFIEKNYNRNSYESSFYHDLKKYLDDPFDYWKKIFLQLSNEAQILLLILSITEQPGIEEILFETFKRVGEHRKLFEKGFERDVFEFALSELSESFIAVGHNPELKTRKNTISSRDLSLIHNPFRSSRFIEFQNPSIKDFAITYLRGREDLIEYLLKSAIVFHQLFFVFSTRKEDKSIEDYEDDYPYTVHKILLSQHLQEVVKEKAILEFDKLATMRFKKISWREAPDTFHADGDDDNRMEKLWLLSIHFPLKEHETIRDFIIKKYFQILEEEKQYDETSHLQESLLRPLSLEERLLQTDVIHKLHPFVTFDPFQTINDYYNNIRFSREFILLDHLREIFPEAYQKIITNNIKHVRQKIKDTIDDDIDYYMWEGTHEAEVALDDLVDMVIEQLMELYKFKLSKKFQANINEMTGREIFKLHGRISQAETIIPQAEENADDEFQPHFSEALNKQQYSSYKHALMRLKPDWKEFEKYPDTSFFYGHILEMSGLSEDAIGLLTQAAHALYIEDEFTFRKETFEAILKEATKGTYQTDKILEILLSAGLLMQEDIWLQLLSRPFHLYLVARYIAMLPLSEKSIVYERFQEIHNPDVCVYDSDIWQYCFDVDSALVKKHFIIPALQNELGLFENSFSNDIPIIFLKNEGWSFTYSYWEEEQCFEFNGSTGGAVLTEDIFQDIELNIVHPFWQLEECFNISRNTDRGTVKYIKKHCPIEDKTYTIDISRELNNKAFHKVIQSSGAAEIILSYLSKVKDYLTMNS